MQLTSATLLLALLAAPLQAAQDSKPPSRKEIDQLVSSYFELDGKTAAGHTEQLRILARLAPVPFPGRSSLRKWGKSFKKSYDKGRELEKKAGDYFYQEQERVGRYIVGGETKKPQGIFLGMHGGGVGSGDAGSSAGAYSAACAELGWVGIFPEVLEKTELGWTTSGTEEFVLDLVEAALRTWDVDPNMVFFGGHSMGGFGSWVLGAHHADRVAALGPSAGAPSPIFGQSGKVIRIQKGVIPNLRNVPMLIFQSADDPKVPPAPNRFAVKELKRSAGLWGGFDRQEYWEVDGIGHGYPDGGPKVLLEKIAGYVRDPRPQKIVWEPELSWKRQFYWLYWDQPEKHALVVAKILKDKNEIEVEVEGDPSGLCVLVDSELVDFERELIVTLTSLEHGWAECFRGMPQPDFATWVMTSAAGDAGRAFTMKIPLAPRGE